MNKNISFRTFVIVLLVIILVIVLVFFIINPSSNVSEDITYAPDSLTVNYEGSFKSKGVIVRPEDDYFILMPIVINKEYSNDIRYSYDNRNSILKKGQEVEIVFHYLKSNNSYVAIVDNVEILKNQSDIDIPYSFLVNSYSSKSNVDFSLDTENCDRKGLCFTITDKNELKYDYSTMEYTLCKYTPPPEKTEIIHTENGGAVAGYDPWSKLRKINNLSTTSEYFLDGKGSLNISIDWSEIYGNLSEGEYKFYFWTVPSKEKDNLPILLVSYRYAGVVVAIHFKINANGIIELGEAKLY